VSRSFDECKATDSDIRTYLALSHRWVESAYHHTWDEAAREFSRRFDPDWHNPEGDVDLFHSKVSGLWAKDYFWMLRAGALRDAVSAFEVYAEKSLAEVLDFYRFEQPNGETTRLTLATAPGYVSPSWPTLRQVHRALGNDIETDAVSYVRNLRHLLTHQRGELRTEEQRALYRKEADADDWLVGDAYVGGDLPLRHERVVAMMSDLAEVVRASDRAVWSHTYGGLRPADDLWRLAEDKLPPLVWVPA
jgi:hypothetical protein